MLYILSYLVLLFSPADQVDDKDEDPNNPFSFKEFVKKDKRRAVYYNSKEADVEGFTPSDSEAVMLTPFVPYGLQPPVFLCSRPSRQN